MWISISSCLLTYKRWRKLGNKNRNIDFFGKIRPTTTSNHPPTAIKLQVVGGVKISNHKTSKIATKTIGPTRRELSFWIPKWHKPQVKLGFVDWQNMGMREVIFSWNIGKNINASYWLFSPIIHAMLFWQIWRKIWALLKVVFYKKIEKIDMRAQCIRENGRFVDKIWDWERMTFFTNMCVGALIFFIKNRKKGYPIDFYSP